MPENKKQIVLSQEPVSLTSPKGLVDFAALLKKHIVDNKLYTEIKKKNYVNVEGWQFAGASTGVMPVVRELTDISNADEIKYRAVVELVRVADGTTVGAGIAVCSDKEANRKGNEEYVIASMAQTRATGKAFRNAFGWLMKMAGYETVPTEEMASDTINEAQRGPKGSEGSQGTGSTQAAGLDYFKELDDHLVKAGANTPEEKLGYIHKVTKSDFPQRYEGLKPTTYQRLLAEVIKGEIK